mmetsp:Transcript_18057/g.63882  ORF Transcript_18057/g.63882 Transcript_18057/m.63882 type:complete len:204 (+) Transcript_18057:196-807(+)
MPCRAASAAAPERCSNDAPCLPSVTECGSFQPVFGSSTSHSTNSVSASNLAAATISRKACRRNEACAGGSPKNAVVILPACSSSARRSASRSASSSAASSRVASGPRTSGSIVAFSTVYSYTPPRGDLKRYRRSNGLAPRLRGDMRAALPPAPPRASSEKPGRISTTPPVLYALMATSGTSYIGVFGLCARKASVSMSTAAMT